MGILSRLSYQIKSSVNSLLNRTSNPKQQLDYSYEQMRDELQDVKKGIADLTTQKKRLQKKRDNLQENVEKHNDQAREAVRQDRDDLAERALEKKQAKLNQIEELDEQIESLQQKQQNLVQKKDDLERQIEEFRTKKETMKARYDAAEAETQVAEALTGAGDEMEDVSRSIERAEQQTEDMEARADALDELQETGALDSALDDGDQIDQELDELTTNSQVESELSTLKSEVGDGEGSRDTEETTSEADAAIEDMEVDSGEVETELADLKNEEQADSGS
ncbi:MAG: PspA/IM30 family protein [Halobacteriales archaeon]